MPRRSNTASASPGSRPDVIIHPSARNAESEPGDLFDKYVDRTTKNPCDIEHVWADNYDPYVGEFSTIEEFLSWRDHIGGLLLLPADVNRSYQAKPFEEKVLHYDTGAAVPSL
jgi:hypothetical protein